MSKETPLRICSMCREAKLITEYCKDKSRASGLSYRCKSCDRIVLDRYKKKQINEGKREQYLERRRKISKKWIKLNSMKATAHGIANRYPVSTSCEHCGKIENLQRHHPDYSHPEIFLTLCPSCHAKEHIRLRSLVN